jgi:molybdate transport system substrate-binding protein
MRIPVFGRYTTTLLLLSMFAASIAEAPPVEATEYRVFSTGAPSVAAKAIAGKFVMEAGNVFEFTVGQPATLQHKLMAGEKADVVIAPSPLIAALLQNGKLRAGSAVDLARVGIGVVVREGAPLPDISNSAAIRKLLLDASSIAYPDPIAGGGFTGKALTRMIADMGIEDQIKPKLSLGAAINGGVKLVADSGAEIGLFNISEILPIKGVTLVGPLPAELQHYIIFSAAVVAGTAIPDPAAAFIKRMAASSAREVWSLAGMEPLSKQ